MPFPAAVVGTEFGVPGYRPRTAQPSPLAGASPFKLRDCEAAAELLFNRKLPAFTAPHEIFGSAKTRVECPRQKLA